MSRYLALSKAVGADDVFTQSDEDELDAIMRKALGDVVLDQSALVGDLVGSDALGIGDPGYHRIMARVGEHVTDINSGTRQAIADTIQQGLDAGYQARQIAAGVAEDDFRGLRSVVEQTYGGRADAIARTEVAMVANYAASDRYADAGVTEVDIDDGPGCGWTEHDDPDEADGSRRTLDDLDEYPISHPNCVRVPLPVLPGDEGGE